MSVSQNLRQIKKLQKILVNSNQGQGHNPKIWDFLESCVYQFQGKRPQKNGLYNNPFCFKDKNESEFLDLYNKLFTSEGKLKTGITHETLEQLFNYVGIQRKSLTPKNSPEYKLYLLKIGSKNYVGCTSLSLEHRLKLHISQAKHRNSNELHKSILNNLDNLEIIPLAIGGVELFKIEQTFISHLFNNTQNLNQSL